MGYGPLNASGTWDREDRSCYNIREFPKPAQTLAIMCAGAANVSGANIWHFALHHPDLLGGGGWENIADSAHEGGYDCLHVDGHVEFIPTDKVMDIPSTDVFWKADHAVNKG
jgi:hypothetical protein